MIRKRSGIRRRLIMPAARRIDRDPFAARRADRRRKRSRLPCSLQFGWCYPGYNRGRPRSYLYSEDAVRDLLACRGGGELPRVVLLPPRRLLRGA